jgi:transcriptional regulator with XRE-family HTH domain
MTIEFALGLPARQLLITQRLRERRVSLGLTQKQVVTRLGRCGLRTTNRALSSLEHGAGIEVAKLPALARALDCSVTYLLGLTDDPHRWEPDHGSGVANPLSAAPHPATDPALANQPSPTPAADYGIRESLILGDDVPDRLGRSGADRRVAAF